MKKLLAAAALTLLGTGAFAQTTKGTVAIGGTVSFFNEGSKRDNNSSRYRRISLNPYVGYFIKDRTEVGAALNLSHSQDSYYYNETENFSKAQSIGLSIYTTKYVALEEKLYLYGTVMAGAGFGGIKRKGEEYPSEVKTHNTNYFNTKLTPGFLYTVTPKLGAFISYSAIYYLNSKEKPVNSVEGAFYSSSETFGADISLNSLQFGLNYFIVR
ncbi:outer membrane beta-barrel protein [Pontibacter ruber]|uniref:Outer membrane beta-barrel protein n=1 Tax=Pontibacter ruber TaxID=1343895 RepID=A0ABW5D0H8_9BACT|nr:outer membrane beta-barrel protein [Pontibacter ruber]